MKESHKCLPELLHQNCPVCMEFMHTSRSSATFMRCGHPIHQSCLVEFIKAGNYKCPLCSAVITDMKREWLRLDIELALTPMPGEYASKWIRVHCNDCNKESDTRFHIVGLKCRASDCGSYNTRKAGEPLESHGSPEEMEAEDARTNAILEGYFSAQGGHLADEDEEDDDDEEGEEEGEERGEETGDDGSESDAALLVSEGDAAADGPHESHDNSEGGNAGDAPPSSRMDESTE
jgi:hypothetical protein